MPSWYGKCKDRCGKNIIRRANKSKKILEEEYNHVYSKKQPALNLICSGCHLCK